MSAATYEPILQLAKGGMGEVELALLVEGTFSRLYAVKRLQPYLLDEPSFVQMFQDEARIAGMLRHPNVVSVLDVGEDARGPYLVMDFVDGLSLQQIMRHHRELGELLPVQLCLRIVHGIAAGLHAAHELRDHQGRPLGLVHRDVSPQNVLVGYDGLVRVTDFGVAKAAGRLTKTTTGVLKGKLGYMAPEQLTFQPVDRRADVFALGIILFELLAGHHPFGKNGDERARNVLSRVTPDVGESREDVPPAIVQLLYRMLASAPELRVESCDEVRRVLGTVLDDLMGAEGVLEIGAYMEQVFSKQRSEAGERIAAAMDRARSAGEAPEPAGEPTVPDAGPPGEPTEPDAGPPIAGKPRIRSSPRVTGGVALALLAAGALWWAISTGAMGAATGTPPEEHAVGSGELLASPSSAPPRTTGEDEETSRGEAEGPGDEPQAAESPNDGDSTSGEQPTERDSAAPRRSRRQRPPSVRSTNTNKGLPIDPTW